MIKGKMLLWLFTLIVITVTGGCDQGKVITAPAGFVVTVNPVSFDWTDTGVSIISNTVDFTIIVYDADGKARDHIELYIDSPVMRAMAVNQIMWFEYPYGTPVYTAIKPVTDSAGGYQLRVGFRSGGGLNYSDDISIMSGSATLATIAFSVSDV